jgi:isoleucyl-tRNA synthetase
MIVLEKLILWLAPVLSFTAEEAFEELQSQLGISDRNSVHTMLFKIAESHWNNQPEFDKWVQIKHIRKVVTSALEIERSAKTIGSSLQAHIDVYVNHNTFELLENVDLNELCIVSSSRLLLANSPANAVTLDDIENVGVVAIPAEGLKCERCWKIYNPSETENDLNICNRCHDVVQKTVEI